MQSRTIIDYMNEQCAMNALVNRIGVRTGLMVAVKVFVPSANLEPILFFL